MPFTRANPTQTLPDNESIVQGLIWDTEKVTHIDLEKTKPFPDIEWFIKLYESNHNVKCILPPGHIIFGKLENERWTNRCAYIRHRSTARWIFDLDQAILSKLETPSRVAAYIGSKKLPLVVRIKSTHGYEAVIIPPWHGKRVTEFRRLWNIIDNPAI